MRIVRDYDDWEDFDEDEIPPPDGPDDTHWM